MSFGYLVNGLPRTRSRILNARWEISLNRARAAGGKTSSSSRILSGGNRSDEGRNMDNSQGGIGA